MKTLTLILAIFLSAHVFAADKNSLLFVGVTESGESCTLTLNSQQNGLFEVFHLQLNNESFYFYNESLDSQGRAPKNFEGLFENHAPDYTPVIGAPIFGMGGYVNMSVTTEYSSQGLESLSIERVDQFAYVFGSMETTRTRIFCQ